MNVSFDELVTACDGRWVLRPLAGEARFAPLLRALCCAWCRRCEERLVPESIRALEIIEQFTRGEQGGDALAIARKMARMSARQVARRMHGKTKEYWACHAVCEAARNDAREALWWTARALPSGANLNREAILRETVARYCDAAGD
jgi:hypothetical protein